MIIMFYYKIDVNAFKNVFVDTSADTVNILQVDANAVNLFC